MPESAQPVIVQNWSAKFDWIQTPFGLVITSLSLTGERTVIDTDPFALRLDRSASWEAFVDQEAIQMFVESRAPDNIRDIKVMIAPEGISVSAKAKALIEIAALAKCEVQIRDGKTLWIEVESVSLGGSPAKSLLQRQLDSINPIVNAADLPLNLTFEGIQLLSGKLRLFGTAEPE